MRNFVEGMCQPPLFFGSVVDQPPLQLTVRVPLPKNSVFNTSSPVCPGVFPIQFSDKAGADFRRTYGLALVGVGAVAETFRIHRTDHF
jgi:hypothetical protein